MAQIIHMPPQVIQDLERQVPQRSPRLLEQLARVALCEGHAEVLADLLEPVLARQRQAGRVDVGRRAGEGL